MLFFVGCVFPYLAVAVFVIGTTWRTASWMSRPVPFPLTLDRGRRGIPAQVAEISQELLLLRSLRRGDRRLWHLAGSMHAALAMILLGHGIGIAMSGQQFTPLGFSSAASTALSRSLGVLFGLLFVASALALLYRRGAVPEVRKLSDPSDYFDLALLLAIAATGLLMRLTLLEPEQAAVRAFLGGLLTLQPVPIPGPWVFIIHFVLVNVMLTYLPFSKLVHLTGGVVSRALVVTSARAHPARRRANPDARPAL